MNRNAIAVNKSANTIDLSHICIIIQSSLEIFQACYHYPSLEVTLETLAKHFRSLLIALTKQCQYQAVV